MDAAISKWVKVFDMPDGNQVLYVNAGMHIKQNGSATQIVLEFSIQISVKIDDRLLTKVKTFHSPEVANQYFNKANQLAATSLYREAQARISHPSNQPNA